MNQNQTVRQALEDAYGDDWAQTMDHVLYQENNGYISLNRTTAYNPWDHQDPIEISNFRHLEKFWENEPALKTSINTRDIIALKLDAIAPEGMIDVINSLREYPVLDETGYSQAEQEIIQDHWERYGQREVSDAVTKALATENDHYPTLTDYAEEIAETLVWGGNLDYNEYGSGYPTMIDLSACDFGDKAVAEFFSANLGNPHVQLGKHVWNMTREKLVEP